MRLSLHRNMSMTYWMLIIFKQQHNNDKLCKNMSLLSATALSPNQSLSLHPHNIFLIPLHSNGHWPSLAPHHRFSSIPIMFIISPRSIVHGRIDFHMIPSLRPCYVRWYWLIQWFLMLTLWGINPHQWVMINSWSTRSHCQTFQIRSYDFPKPRKLLFVEMKRWLF